MKFSIHRKSLVTFLSLVLVVCLAWGADAAENPSDRLKAYAEMVKAQAEYGKMLIEARIADSKIQLNLAEAEYKTTLAAALRVQIEAMQYELARIKDEDRKMGFKIAEIESLSACTNHLSMGDSNPHIIHHCLGRFLFSYVPPSILKAVMQVPIPNLNSSPNFRANNETVITEDFPGGNMGQLMDFVGAREISFVRWSAVHFHFLDMMTQLAAHAEAQIARYQSYMVGIRSGTLNIWTLPKS